MRLNFLAKQFLLVVAGHQPRADSSFSFAFPAFCSLWHKVFHVKHFVYKLNKVHGFFMRSTPIPLPI
jgi:hypothetical protein